MRPIPILPVYLNNTRDLTVLIDLMESVRGGCILAELEQWIALRTSLSERQNHRCCWCGTAFTETLNSTHYPTIEHVVPKSLGGSNHPDNLAVACSRCNQKRKTKSVEDFLKQVVANQWAHPRLIVDAS